MRAQCCVAVQDRRLRESGDRRRRTERRQQADRRKLRVEALQAELNPLRDAVRQNAERIRELEREQRTQLVRIAQIQRELDDLKKSRSGGT